MPAKGGAGAAALAGYGTTRRVSKIEELSGNNNENKYI